MYSQSIFQHINQNAQVMGYMFLSLEMLKGKTTPLGRVKKNYFEKFRHKTCSGWGFLLLTLERMYLSKLNKDLLGWIC